MRNKCDCLIRHFEWAEWESEPYRTAGAYTLLISDKLNFKTRGNRHTAILSGQFLFKETCQIQWTYWINQVEKNESPKSTQLFNVLSKKVLMKYLAVESGVSSIFYYVICNKFIN